MQQIDTPLDIWGESLLKAGSHPLYKIYKDVYRTIDAIQEGNVKRECFSLKYTNILDEEDQAWTSWMDVTYDVWYLKQPMSLTHLKVLLGCLH